MSSLIPSFSLKLHLNSLVYDRNIFESSSKVFSNLRKSSEFFGKCSEKFVWPSEQFWKIFLPLERNFVSSRHRVSILYERVCRKKNTYLGTFNLLRSVIQWLHYFPAAMLVSLLGTPTLRRWRIHTYDL